jgi:hypothetical protein
MEGDPVAAPAGTGMSNGHASCGVLGQTHDVLVLYDVLLCRHEQQGPGYSIPGERWQLVVNEDSFQTLAALAWRLTGSC